MQKIAFGIGHNFAKWDKGASGNGTTEADVTKMIIDTIIKRGISGFQVVKCPEGLDIPGRNKWVNSQVNLSAYFELHLDSATPQATGCCVYYVGGNEWAKNEAIQYQRAYTTVTGLHSRWVNADTTNRWGRLGAIRDNNVFSLLMELGFISNSEDLAIIRAKGIDGIISGIRNMFAK